MDKYLFDIDNYIAWYRDILTVSIEVDKRNCTAFHLQTMLQRNNYIIGTTKNEAKSKKIYERLLLKFNTLNEHIGYYYSPKEWLVLDVDWWNSLESSFKRNKYNFDLDNKLMLAKNKTDARKTIINLHIEKLGNKKLTFLKSYKETKAIPLLNYHSKYREEFKGLDLGYIQEKTFYSFINDIWIIKGLDYANQLLEDLAENNISEIVGRLKWIGKPSQLGHVFSELVQKGYIEAPTKKDGEINYNELARLIKDTFNINSTANTLAKSLNPDSESGQISATNKAKFKIPDIIEIS